VRSMNPQLAGSLRSRVAARKTSRSYRPAESESRNKNASRKRKAGWTRDLQETSRSCANSSSTIRCRPPTAPNRQFHRKTWGKCHFSSDSSADKSRGYSNRFCIPRNPHLPHRIAYDSRRKIRSRLGTFFLSAHRR
jgi:hypothetical protein